MKKFLLLIVMLLVLFYHGALAQVTVSGKVTDAADNSPIPGVNVVEKGTTNGSVTDFDGNYTITVGEEATLLFSFVGYQTQEQPVSGRSSINISLATDVTQLSEVVVIGYGQIEAKDATGAVATVKAEDFNGGVISSPEQLIQGKTAGVQITSASGEPGAGVNIRIRGTSSVRNGNNPLFVVDGIPLSGGDVTAGGLDLSRGTSTPRNPLNFINPNDIASIDILKDASATAIYGSRGANGVVIITTKSGSGAKGTVEYGTSLSVSRSANEFDLLDRDSYLAGLVQFGADPAELDFGSNTDWQDEILRTAVSNKHDLSYSSSHKSGSYRVSVGYENQQGIVENSAMERINGRLNLNQKFLNDRLNFNAQITLSRINDENPPISDNAGFEGDLLGATYLGNPTLPADADVQEVGFTNPLSMLKYTLDESETDRSLINLSLDYDILKELNFKVNVGLDNSSSERDQSLSPLLRTGKSVFQNGRAGVGEVETSSTLVEAFFNYTKKLGGGSFSALLGYSYQEFEREGFTLQGFGFTNDDMNANLSDLRSSGNQIRSLISGSYQQFGYTSDSLFVSRLFPVPQSVRVEESLSLPVRAVTENRFEEVDELQSFFGRVNYSLKDKYLFTATMRADGSTRFGGDNKYGFFPSAAFAWRISDENFAPEAFTDLKFRLGYGVTGNQEIPHNLHQRRQRFQKDDEIPIEITDGGEINPPGLETVAFDNPDLKWEQTSQFNAGIDFGLLEGRLNGTLDLYHKNTTDLLIQITSAQPAPQDFTWVNLDADVINRGVELSLNYIILDKNDLTWDFGFNVAYNDNEVKNFDGIIDTGEISGQGLTGAFAQRIADGEPLFAYFLRDFAGYDNEGLSVYNGGDAQQFLDGKSPLPLWNLGISTSVEYKDFDLSIFMAGQFGHYIYNNTANGYFTAGAIGNGRNVIGDVLTSGESNLNAPDVSTRFLESGDFLRMQNIALGYNFNMDNVNFINSLRLYANVQNLFVITDYSGLDPEVNVNKSLDGVPSLGIDYTAYPRARTFTFGLNVAF